MTTYNGDKFLKLQLDSILAQTVTDFELIVCDDNSFDSTWNILTEYSQKDKRIHIYRNEKNLGYVKNFEKSITLCSGDYIALSDQDDIWKKHHLEILMNNLKEATGVAGNAEIINSRGDVSKDTLSKREKYFNDGNSLDKLYRILFYGNPFQGASSLFKAELFQKALPIPKEVEYQDAWFNSFACCMNGFNFVNEVVNQYRIHESNASGNHKLSFFKQLKIALIRKSWKTDRLIYCNELLNRLPNMKENIKQVVLSAKFYHENRIARKKIVTILFTIRNYKKIYATNSYKQLFVRCIGILLKG